MHTRILRLHAVLQSSVLFHATVSLALVILGTGIYWIFRGIPFLQNAPLFTITTHPIFNVLIFNMPDGLWLYGLLSALRSVWGDQLSTSGTAWLYSTLFLTLCTELAQYTHIIPGTFDILDLAAYLCAGGLFLYLNHFRQTNLQL